MISLSLPSVHYLFNLFNQETPMTDKTKQALPEGWVICTDKGVPLESTFAHMKNACVNNFMINIDLPGYANTWRQLKVLGYTCLPAEIRVVLIKEKAKPTPAKK